jgi:hypothetical protein
VNSREIVSRTTILRATVGSTVRGLHHVSQDDRDEMVVYVEPPEFLRGSKRFHLQSRTGRQSIAT